MPFEFATAARIVFGPGSIRSVAPAARLLGSRALLVTGRSRERARALEADLARAGVTCWWFAINGEPAIDQVSEGAVVAKSQHCEMIIGMGGGSAIDGGKAIAALATNPGPALEYLEVIGQGQPLTAAPLPFIAIPTTAGTGSEVTRNAVLGSRQQRVKVSLRSPLMLAKLAVVDPELTLDLPPAITASTGLDALTQLIEPYVSIRANAMTDLFCIDGMSRISRALVRAFETGHNHDARTDMSYASLLGGLALANAGLGLVHGIAGPLGGMFEAPHGAVCAALLPYGMDVNIKALQNRGESVERYAAVARTLTGNSHASAKDGVNWVQALCKTVQVPPLRTYGVTLQHVPDLVDKAARASSMKANPCVLKPEEISETIVCAI